MLFPFPASFILFPLSSTWLLITLHFSLVTARGLHSLLVLRFLSMFFCQLFPFLSSCLVYFMSSLWFTRNKRPRDKPSELNNTLVTADVTASSNHVVFYHCLSLLFLFFNVILLLASLTMGPYTRKRFHYGNTCRSLITNSTVILFSSVCSLISLYLFCLLAPIYKERYSAWTSASITFAHSDLFTHC